MDKGREFQAEGFRGDLLSPSCLQPQRFCYLFYLRRFGTSVILRKRFFRETSRICKSVGTESRSVGTRLGRWAGEGEQGATAYGVGAGSPFGVMRRFKN